MSRLQAVLDAAVTDGRISAAEALAVHEVCAELAGQTWPPVAPELKAHLIALTEPQTGGNPA